MCDTIDNEIYEPVEPNYYNYKAVSNLSKTLDTYNKNYTIEICAYEVNNDGKYPFLKYLLFKNFLNNNLTFISNVFSTHNDFELTVELSIRLLFGLLQLKEYSSFEENCVFNGVYQENDILYLFFDLTKCKLVLNDVYSSSTLWFCLIDEIINQGNVCDNTIDETVKYFFINNFDFCNLNDRKDETYEIPTVGYVGKPEPKVNFTYIFGEQSKNKDALLGPFYYFTNYKNACDEVGAIQEKTGIIRFALFVGKVKYIENHPNDEIDLSEIKQQRLNDDSLDKKIEHLTMRISDHDGMWSLNYDSVHIGIIALDDDSLLHVNNQIVVKEYNQQIPISYHYNVKYEVV